MTRFVQFSSVTLLLLATGCRSSEESAWKGLELDPVTSQEPLEGTPTQAEPIAEGAAVPAAAGADLDMETDAEPEEDSESAAEKAAREAEELEFSIEKKVREIYQADLELEIAEQKALATEAKMAGDLEVAQASKLAAEEALEQYTKVEAPQLSGAAKLKVDERRFEVEMAEQELQQMETEYGQFQADTHAAQTGQIVIWREQQKLDHAKRKLALEVARKKTLEEYTIPRKQRELDLEVSKAQRGLERVKAERVSSELEIKLSLRKAKDKQGLLKFELDRLREKLSDV